MQELLNLAISAAREAGKEILKHYEKFEIYEKEDKSPLTTADLAANEIILKILGKSGIKICSEESILSADERKNAEMFWLVDPLDGTKEFIAQNGEFCVCIALIKAGRPILSAIYIPVSDELFYSKGEGIVYKNGEILPKCDRTPNLFLLGRHGNSAKRTELASKFSYELKRIGSAIKFCRICENKAGGYSRLGPSSLWDIAAGDFLVTQSGGMIIDLKTCELPRYDSESLINNPYLVLDRNNIKFLDEMLKNL